MMTIWNKNTDQTLSKNNNPGSLIFVQFVNADLSISPTYFYFSL
jgi:hypothetical protein